MRHAAQQSEKQEQFETALAEDVEGGDECDVLARLAERGLLRAVGGNYQVGESFERMVQGRVEARVRKPRQGARLTDDELQVAAEVYRDALRRGAHPTQTVQRVMHVSRSTAGRWVMECRKRALLGPTTERRAGEQS
jgi:hypothetical protein